MSLAIVSPDHNNENPLARFGLDVSMLHTGLSRSLRSATNRTEMAPPGAPGSDIYYTGVEDLSSLLAEHGWQRITPSGQVRLVHPEGLMSFTIASARYVRDRDLSKPPRTNDKGDIVRQSLARESNPHPTLFEMSSQQEIARLESLVRTIPFWMLLHERSSAGLHIEFSRPLHMGAPEGNAPVTDWDERIFLPHVPIADDFGPTDEPGDDFDFDVPTL